MGISDENKHLEDLDKKYIWHPFTQMRDWLEEKPVIISEGRDCFIKDIYGRWYLDGVSSMWVNIHGHRKKEIDEAIKEQIDRISHSTLLGLSNVPAIQLSERLIKLFSQSLVGSQLPNPPIPLLVKGGGGGFKVFYSDNGSTSVEVALKMAFQYWLHKGVTGKNSFLSLENAYHGDTLGAVSVGGIETFHKVFRPLLFKTYNAPSPYCYRCESGLSYPDCKTACLKKMEAILRKHSSEIAAVIIEPLVQAAGGMLVAPAGYLKGVRDLCTKYKALMIADEVATGFGRTGKMFACEHEAVTPDIMCLSKGITGGYLPLAVTIATDEIYNAFLGEFRELKTFFHGHSYTGNPLACAAALACLDIFEKEETLKNLQPKIELLEGWLKEISELPHVGDARNKGLMAGVELVKDKNTKEPYAWEEKMGWKAAYHARDNGVFIRPLGNVMVIMPPLSISIENLGRMLGIIKNAISAVT
ncbi:MAG: adenosylmethionine--8-amino-7-oxononanoate transaminase [Nitrospirae bacterium CG_4_10_14_3_um_filter_44_29]|nr:MAG: adenosylmethionine--8-amino-7-oxononanoate transaminase [Nitrospirae bacterium CG_4_10_14_3_um_filter_44_29]PJA82486.1 MAG: adenosylmethionine--8-amino-7-oxononanoate transaminase [Nitrospirae bacterium CG_4_9_14_3_um_filter_44_28]